MQAGGEPLCVRSAPVACWQELVVAYSERLVRRGASGSTIVTEMRALRGFSRFLAQRGYREVNRMAPADLAAFAVWLSKRRVPLGHRKGRRWSSSSVLTWTNTVRRFLRWVARSEHTLVDFSLWIASVKVPATLPRVLSQDEVERLLTTPPFGESPGDLRNRAVLELLYASGLRVGELAGLDLADLDVLEGEVHVWRGKGGRDRRVPIGAAAIEAVTAYLQRGRELQCVRRAGGPSRAVFLSARGNRFAVQDVEKMVRRRGREVGLKERITPHALRHTAAVHLLRGGADLRYIQEFLGHASVGTTARYTRLCLEDLRQTLDRAHPRSRLKLPIRS